MMDYDKLFKGMSMGFLFKSRDALQSLEDLGWPDVTDKLYYTEKEIAHRVGEQHKKLMADSDVLAKTRQIVDRLFNFFDPEKCMVCGKTGKVLIKGVCEECRYANEDLRPGGGDI